MCRSLPPLSRIPLASHVVDIVHLEVGLEVEAELEEEMGVELNIVLHGWKQRCPLNLRA
jgi:hypothetical protein